MSKPSFTTARAATTATVAGFAAALLPVPAWALDPPPLLRDYGPMWSRGGWDGWQAHIMVMWPVFLLLVIVAAILLAMRISYGLWHEVWPGSPHVNPRSPVASGHQILAERFARGEIDETEYHAKRKALGKR